MWSRFSTVRGIIARPFPFRRPATQFQATFTKATSAAPQQPLAPGTELSGHSGRAYRLTKILHHRQRPLFICVYLAQGPNGNKHVLKTIFRSEYDYQWETQAPLAGSPHVRLPTDCVPEQLAFVYDYRTDHLLDACCRKDIILSVSTRKRILRDALRGLAALEKGHFFHTDVKPDNIFLDLEASSGHNPSDALVKNVQLGDLESGCDLKPGKYITGPMIGNHMWRSPEAFVRTKIGLASDVFSFAIVCIFVMLDKILFQLPPDIPPSNELQMASYLLERQFSIFGDTKSIDGLLEHVADNSRSQNVILSVRSHWDQEEHMFWKDVDAPFRDVILRMANLDPTQQITASEALEHPWFSNIDD